MGLMPSHLLHRLQSRGEYECLCVTPAGLRTKGSSRSPGLCHLQRPSGPASASCPRTTVCPEALVPLCKFFMEVVAHVCAQQTSLQAVSCLTLAVWNQSFQESSFSSHLSEVSSVGFFKETLKFSIYLHMQKKETMLQNLERQRDGETKSRCQKLLPRWQLGFGAKSKIVGSSARSW